MSTIALMQSRDGGLTWVTVEADLIPPELDSGLSWKHAYVYGFDTVPGQTCNSRIYAYVDLKMQKNKSRSTLPINSLGIIRI